MKPQIKIGWSCLGGHVHDTAVEAQACIDATAAAQRTDPHTLTDRELRLHLAEGRARMEGADVRYLVHEAGPVAADGIQTCRRCGFVILGAAPPRVNRQLWGFPVGRRVVQGPTCTFLVTADRQLAPDEVSCS